jgi:hypothetical protein
MNELSGRFCRDDFNIFYHYLIHGGKKSELPRKKRIVNFGQIMIDGFFV